MRKDAQHNKKLIEQQALSLFEAYGVDAVSMNQLSKSLNIGMGTLYRHFSDKSALCYQLIANDFSSLFNEFDHIAQSTESRKQKLAQHIDVFLAFKADHQALLHCVEQGKKTTDFKQSDVYQQLFDYFYPLMTGDSKWKTFQTDMLLNALTTASYEYQTQQQHLTHAALKNYLMQLFYKEALS